MALPLVPRPDQRVIAAGGFVPGSRAGSGELAGALAFPGVPPAVPNLQAATIVNQNVSIGPFFVFPAAGRIWQVVLSYAVVTNHSFSLSTAKSYAAVETVIGGLTLAVVEQALANPDQHDHGQSDPSYNGLPVASGEKLVMDVNGGNTIPNYDQRASAVVLYSIP